MDVLQLANHVAKGSTIWLPRSIIVNIAVTAMIKDRGITKVLADACYDNNREALEYILKNYKLRTGTITILITAAAKKGYREIVKMLLSYATLNGITLSRYKLHVAAQYAAMQGRHGQMKDLVAYLIERGPLTEHSVDQLFSETAGRGNIKHVKNLIVVYEMLPSEAFMTKIIENAAVKSRRRMVNFLLSYAAAAKMEFDILGPLNHAAMSGNGRKIVRALTRVAEPISESTQNSIFARALDAKDKLLIKDLLTYFPNLWVGLIASALFRVSEPEFSEVSLISDLIAYATDKQDAEWYTRISTVISSYNNENFIKEVFICAAKSKFGFRLSSIESALVISVKSQHPLAIKAILDYILAMNYKLFNGNFSRMVNLTIERNNNAVADLLTEYTDEHWYIIE